MFRTIGLVIAVLAITACTANDPYQRTRIGALTGAIAGGVIGHQLDHRSGKYVGAAIGALAGGATGNYMDRQQQAFERTLAEERERYNLEIERLQDGRLKLNIPSEVSFDVDSAAIKPAFVGTLDKVGDILQEYNQTTILIVGHTDDTGAEDYNMNLSQRRATSVADFLAGQGVDYQRLRTEGRGELEPRAGNDTPQGRQINRRVEMFINPVVAGQEQQAFQEAPPQW